MSSTSADEYRYITSSRTVPFSFCRLSRFVLLIRMFGISNSYSILHMNSPAARVKCLFVICPARYICKTEKCVDPGHRVLSLNLSGKIYL